MSKWGGVRQTEVEGIYLRPGTYLRGLIWAVVEGTTNLGERIIPGPGVLEEVSPGRGLPSEREEKGERGTERGVPGRGAWPRGVGCPRVSGTHEPWVCLASLESPGDFLTEDPGGARFAEE